MNNIAILTSIVRLGYAGILYTISMKTVSVIYASFAILFFTGWLSLQWKHSRKVSLGLQVLRVSDGIALIIWIGLLGLLIAITNSFNAQAPNGTEIVLIGAPLILVLLNAFEFTKHLEDFSDVKKVSLNI